MEREREEESGGKKSLEEEKAQRKGFLLDFPNTESGVA